MNASKAAHYLSAILRNPFFIYTTLPHCPSNQAIPILMEVAFETLIASYLQDNIGIADHFITDVLAQQLQENVLGLHFKKALIAAGTGNDEKLSFDTAVRSDAIYWLDKSHNNPYETQFLEQIEAFIVYLNNSCYAGVTGYEFHYSLYEAGAFYVRHLDQFEDNNSRAFSMVSYLNADWQTADGGELQVHHTNSDQNIAPTRGKTVFFKSSELSHEVLVTQVRRMSVTGWLKRD
jgi:SM-20-related protein